MAAFDRVLAGLSVVMCQQVGLPQIAGLFMFYLLQHISFHLITSFGRSVEEFCNTEGDITGQGVLQGSSSAAPIYVINSDVSLATYYKVGHGSTFYHLISKDPIEDKTVQYVDNTSQCTNIPQKKYEITRSITDTSNTLHQLASQNAALWSECLWLSDGQLNSQKCYYFAFQPYINFKNNKNMHRNLPMQKDVDIINRATGRTVNIPMISHDVAKRPLGVNLSPAGAHSAQLWHMLQYAKVLTGKIRNSTLSQKAKLMAVNSVIGPAILYPLVNTFYL